MAEIETRRIRCARRCRFVSTRSGPSHSDLPGSAIGAKVEGPLRQEK